MEDLDWDGLDLEKKLDRLREEFDAFLLKEDQNISARQWRHDQLVKRVEELEKALKRMESQIRPGS